MAEKAHSFTPAAPAMPAAVFVNCVMSGDTPHDCRITDAISVNGEWLALVHTPFNIREAMRDPDVVAAMHKTL